MAKRNPVIPVGHGNSFSREALLRIFQELLSKARGTEKGILRDRDPEFLHSYRVALRKLRSLTDQIPGIFPKPVSACWQKPLKDICRATNTLRDLDIFLLERHTLEKSLPTRLREGLNPFFEDITQRRDIEARAVRHWLKSRKYRTQIARIRRSWDSLQKNSIQPTADSTLRELAGKCLRRQFRRIQKSMDGDMSDAALHKVRIECKRMRYILECFGDLFRQEAVKPVVKNLKKLQTRLGRHNDTSIQQDYLLQYVSKPLAARDARQALAIGGLIGGLRQEHIHLRKSAVQALDDFCRGEGAKTFLQLAKEKPN